MDLESMTPDEIRAYAARKEATELHRSHIGGDEPAPVAGSPAAPAPERHAWERDVEVDGVTFTVDMRRFRSREFMRRALSMKSDKVAAEDQLALFDYCFEPVEGQILAEVERRVGYEDYMAYYEICAKLFEAVEAKNS